MPALIFSAMPTIDAEAFWSGAVDAYGLPPERFVSDGPGHPCRHCLRNIDAGQGVLVFAYRPFPALQPYAETGPVFLHQTPCARYAATEIVPPVIAASRDVILRGYDGRDRIVYGTGAVTAVADVPAYAEALLQRSDVVSVHVRSARNNCYLCRMERTKTPAPLEAGADF